MQTHADKNQGNQSRSSAAKAGNKQKQNSSAFHFVDNRPEVAQMKRLQELANNNPQNQQLTQPQKMANAYAAKQKKSIQQLDKEANVIRGNSFQMKFKENKNSTPGSITGEKTNGSHSHIFNNAPIQRVIGAELEVDGILKHNDKKEFVQGQIIGRIQQGSGKITEIHAEGPKKEENMWHMGMEFATGVYNTIATEKVSHMPLDANELAKITPEIKSNPAKYLNSKEFDTKELNGAKANVQINVSPNTGNTRHLAEFVEKGATIDLREQSEDKRRGKGNSEIKEGVVSHLTGLLTNESNKYKREGEYEALDQRFYQEIIPTLVIHICGLINYNYYTIAAMMFQKDLKGMMGTEKNALPVMPRFDLWKIILSKLREVYGKEATLDDEGFKKFTIPARSLVSQMGVLRGQLRSCIGRVNEENAKVIEADTITQIKDLIQAKSILVPSRSPLMKENDGNTILKDTDTSKIALSPETSPEGAYEIRKPFAQHVPIGYWGGVLKEYEGRLYKDGVRYLKDQ
jgi:hypothetical protein